MSTRGISGWVRAPGRAHVRVNRTDRAGDLVLRALCVLAGLLAAVTLAEIVYQIVNNASASISHFGLPFLWNTRWAPNFGAFGAGTVLFGTAVCSAMALALAAPLGIAIGLYLSVVAPSRVRVIVGPLVEMLAAIPSVVIGFWGLIVLAPFVQRSFEPWLHGAFGFIPIFGSQETTGLSIFTAGIVLAFMVLPIIAALSRDLFLTVPSELKEGAEALGATRWEVIRGVVLPNTISGVAAATMLGLGRALGEAIAVAEVIGGGTLIHASLFAPGNTLAARIALEIQSPVSQLHTASMFYLALILLVICAASNLIAQAITARFGSRAALA